MHIIRAIPRSIDPPRTRVLGWVSQFPAGAMKQHSGGLILPRPKSSDGDSHRNGCVVSPRWRPDRR